MERCGPRLTQINAAIDRGKMGIALMLAATAALRCNSEGPAPLADALVGAIAQPTQVRGQQLAVPVIE